MDFVLAPAACIVWRYESPDTIVRLFELHLFDVVVAVGHSTQPSGDYVAMRGRFGQWLPLLFAVIAALEGWLTLGLLAQSSLMTGAALRGIREKVGAALGGARDVK